jgi:RHS repeat-associated protein
MTYAYDYANRPISLTQTLAGAPGNQIVTQYGYDVLNNVNSVTDPNGNITTYNNDDFARVRTENSPVSGLSSYAYDPADNLTSFTDANGATTTSTFDALDRILSATSVRSGYSNDVVSWTYDDATSGHFGIGRMATMTDPTGSVSYTYERRGLLKTEARTVLSNLYNLAYGYDYNGNRNSLTYPDTSAVAYTFDWADRPISATSVANHFVTSAAYEPFGPIAQLVFGNGSKQTFSFDQRYRPTEDKLINGATTIADYLYAEDSVGNITQIHDNTNAAYNRDFAYDDLNRLTTANSGSSLWGTLTGNGYTYDLMGNLKTIQLGSGRTASFAYSGTTPKLTSVTENGTPRSVGYDSAGNEMTVGSATYAYTPRNVLSSGDGLSYVTDGWGRREVSTTSSGSRYSFYGPDMTLLSESNVTTGVPTVAYDYIWFGGRPVAQTDSTGVHYTVADHLGTPLLQTDSSANVYFRMETEPYGKVWALRAGDGHQPLRLPGQIAEQFDTGANGLTERSYNLFRWYQPGWGRYTQGDPIGLVASVNPFEYIGDAPLNTFDFWGLCRIQVEFNFVGEFKGYEWWHSFLLMKDPSGTNILYRGGPSKDYGDNPLPPLIGGAVSPGSGGSKWGDLWAQPYPGWDTSVNTTNDNVTNFNQRKRGFKNPEITVIEDDQPCDCYKRDFNQAMQLINRSNTPYNGLTTSSNAVTTSLMWSIGKGFITPPVNVPGWDWPIPGAPHAPPRPGGHFGL